MENEKSGAKYSFGDHTQVQIFEREVGCAVQQAPPAAASVESQPDLASALSALMRALRSREQETRLSEAPFCSSLADSLAREVEERRDSIREVKQMDAATGAPEKVDALLAAVENLKTTPSRSFAEGLERVLQDSANLCVLATSAPAVFSLLNGLVQILENWLA